MVLHPSLDIAFTRYDPKEEPSRESLLGLGNGLLFVRACPSWAFADGIHYPGTYRAGCYGRLESLIEGERVETESLVNLPNWLPLNLRLEGETEWFSLEAFEILEYRHALDPRRNANCREVLFRDRLGRRTRLRERCLVSMARAEIAALFLEIVAEDWSGHLEIRAGLDGAVVNDRVGRFRPFARRHLAVLRRDSPSPGTLLLTARIARPEREVAVAARTRLGCEAEARSVQVGPLVISETFHCRLEQGRPLMVEKVAAIVTSRDGKVRDAADAALGALEQAPDFAALEEEHVQAWASLRDRVGVSAEDRSLGDAAAYHAFHLLQTVSPHSAGVDAGLPARGWQEAYHGHIFWDELFLFPFLDLRWPELARGLLLYRWRRLDAAREEARRRGLRGALFPWRSASSGQEETPLLQLNPLSGRFMRDHTRLQWHIGAAIARNLWFHCEAMGDDAFLAGQGGEMLLEIARFYASAAHHDPAEDRYDLRGVVGPDEFHNAYPGAERPGIDTNAYTNVMAVWTLCRALDLLGKLPEDGRHSLCAKLDLDAAELALWERVSRRMRLPFDREGRLAQFEGFDRLLPLNPAEMARRHPGKRIDWLLEARGETADAYQVIKQPDMMMLLYLLPQAELQAIAGRLGYRLTEACIHRSVRHHLSLTAHDSSLSDAVCAAVLARMDPEGSWRHFRNALHPSDDPTTHSTAAEGLHLGTMAGMLDVLQRHYLGLQVGAEGLRLDPAIPPDLCPVRLDIRCRFGGFVLEWTGSALRLASAEGNAGAVAVAHPGGTARLAPGESVTVAAC